MFTIGVFISCLGFCVTFGLLVPFYPDLAQHAMIVPLVSISSFALHSHWGYALLYSVRGSHVVMSYSHQDALLALGFWIYFVLYIHFGDVCFLLVTIHIHIHIPAFFWAWDRIESDEIFLHACCRLGCSLRTDMSVEKLYSSCMCLKHCA